MEQLDPLMIPAAWPHHRFPGQDLGMLHRFWSNELPYGVEITLHYAGLQPCMTITGWWC